MTFTKTQSEEAKKDLRKMLSMLDTDTIYVVQRHVSKSGMRRQLDLYVTPSIEAIRKHDDLYMLDKKTIEPMRITYQVAQALQWVYNTKYDTIQVNGTGMDMHFHTVYTLSMALYCDYEYDHDSAYRLKHITL